MANIKTNRCEALRELLYGINAALTLNGVQQSVDKFATHRSREFKERQGHGGVIVSLFEYFKDMPEFQWKFECQLSCTCHEVSKRDISLGPLIQIPSKSLISKNGDCKDAIIASLTGYMAQCPGCQLWTSVEKKPVQIPQYLMVVLEYPEDIDKKIISTSELFVIKIEEVFTLLDKIFRLMAIIYFQGMHYTCHVNGVYQNKLIPQTNNWFYHDGKQANYIKREKTIGALVSEDPSLRINLESAKLRPYILIYKVNDS